MNVERLRAVKAAILAQPASVDMELIWDEQEQCGSIGCIAGHALHLFDQVKLAEAIDRQNWGIAQSDARVTLGLSKGAARTLFDAGAFYWPDSLRCRLEDSDAGTPEYAQVVADAIDDFIATDGWGLEPKAEDAR